MKYPYSAVQQNCLSIWIYVSMVIDYKISMTPNGSITFETGSTHRQIPNRTPSKRLEKITPNLQGGTEDWQTLGTNETELAVQDLGKGCNEVSKR